MKIGDILKQARSEKGLTLSQVAKEIYVHEKYLRALEEGDYDAIPGEAYQRAYFRSYANFLGLTEYIDSITKPHKFTQEEEAQPDDSVLGGSWDGARVLRVAIRLALIVIAVFVVVFAVRAMHRPPKPEDKDRRVPSTQPGLVVVPIDNEPVWNPPSDSPSAGDSSSDQPRMSHEIKLVAREACWVEVKTRDEVKMKKMMVAGEKASYTDMVGFYVKAGLPNKLDITFDGKKVTWDVGSMEIILPPGAAVIPPSVGQGTADNQGQKSGSTD